ncbi:hypothetical protein [Alloscardovia omnicolens]
MDKDIYQALNWRDIDDIFQLEGKRAIIRMKNDSVLDTKLWKLKRLADRIDPDQYMLQIDASDSQLNQFIALFINTRSGERRLNPTIKSIEILEPTPAATAKDNNQ